MMVLFAVISDYIHLSSNCSFPISSTCINAVVSIILNGSSRDYHPICINFDNRKICTQTAIRRIRTRFLGNFLFMLVNSLCFSIVLIKQWRKNSNQDNRKAACKSYYFIFHISYKSHRFELQY